MVILFSEVASYGLLPLSLAVLQQQHETPGLQDSVSASGCICEIMIKIVFLLPLMGKGGREGSLERKETQIPKLTPSQWDCCSTGLHSLKQTLLSLFPLVDQWKRMSKVLRSAGHDLVPVKENLIDTIWTDRPQRPCKPLIMLDLSYTGEKLYS